MNTFRKCLDGLYSVLFISLLLFAVVLIFRGCPEDSVIPEGYVLVSQSSLDSLEAVTNSIPDTVIVTDTIRPLPVVRWRERVPEPTAISNTYCYYQDSIKDENLSIYINDSISNTGIINYRQVGYKLFIPLQIDRRITVTQKVPVPVRTIEYRTVPGRELYGVLGFGGGPGGFVASGEIDLLTKNKRLYGLQYVRTDQDWYIVKVGFKF